MKLTEKYYQDQFVVFYQTPELFHVFLESDFKLVSRIGGHKLNHDFEKVKLQSWIDFFKNWCLKQTETKQLDLILVYKNNIFLIILVFFIDTYIIFYHLFV